MHINHIAIRVKDIEIMKEFYSLWFNGESNSKYTNIDKGFESYFINFKNNVKLELMKNNRHSFIKSNENNQGYAHIAFSSGSKDAVNDVTDKMKTQGVKIISEPRITGVGYFEGVVLDPEGNVIELTI